MLLVPIKKFVKHPQEAADKLYQTVLFPLQRYLGRVQLRMALFRGKRDAGAQRKVIADDEEVGLRLEMANNGVYGPDGEPLEEEYFDKKEQATKRRFVQDFASMGALGLRMSGASLVYFMGIGGATWSQLTSLVGQPGECRPRVYKVYHGTAEYTKVDMARDRLGLAVYPEA